MAVLYRDNRMIQMLIAKSSLIKQKTIFKYIMELANNKKQHSDGA